MLYCVSLKLLAFFFFLSWTFLWASLFKYGSLFCMSDLQVVVKFLQSLFQNLCFVCCADFFINLSQMYAGIDKKEAQIQCLECKGSLEPGYSTAGEGKDQEIPAVHPESSGKESDHL